MEYQEFAAYRVENMSIACRRFDHAKHFVCVERHVRMKLIKGKCHELQPIGHWIDECSFRFAICSQ